MRIGDVVIGGRVLTAPMTGVSDLPFRQSASRCGAPYVATEMVACDSFARGRPDVVRRAAIGEGLGRVPMVVQLVGRTPEWIAKGARLAQEAGADIIDLNMGCPAKEVTGALSGSALMREPELAARLIDAAVSATTRPVTLKMRLGWDDQSRNAPQIAAMAEGLGVKAITVHGRTRNQFYSGSADWRAVALVKQAVRVPVIVNGDIVDADSTRAALVQSGADAVMIGRGAQGQPWLPGQIGRRLDGGAAEAAPALPQQLHYIRALYDEICRLYGLRVGLRHARKHLGWALDVAGIASRAPAEKLKAWRQRILTSENPADVHQALASEIRSRLTPRIRPNYVARLAVRVVKVDEPEAEIGVMYPDIEVLYSRRRRRMPPAERAPAETWAGMTPAPLSLTSYPSVEYRLVTIEVRAVTGHRLVTAIDGHPATLSWIGGVAGHRTVALGVEHFGQTGTVGDLYRHYGIDAAGIAQAVSHK